LAVWHIYTAASASSAADPPNVRKSLSNSNAFLLVKGGSARCGSRVKEPQPWRALPCRIPKGLRSPMAIPRMRPRGTPIRPRWVARDRTITPVPKHRANVDHPGSARQISQLPESQTALETRRIPLHHVTSARLFSSTAPIGNSPATRLPSAVTSAEKGQTRNTTPLRRLWINPGVFPPTNFSSLTSNHSVRMKLKLQFRRKKNTLTDQGTPLKLGIVDAT